MWGTGYALRKATVMRTKILSVTPINPLGVTAPLTSKGSQENCVNAIPCRGYNPSVSFADSSPYTGEPRMRSVRLSSFSKYVCGRRPLFGFIHYAARRILRAEIILQIRRHKSGYAESLRRIKALHIPAGDFSCRGSRVAGGKNAFHGLASPKEHHFAPFPCSIRE